jgi:hypothetical protein
MDALLGWKLVLSLPAILLIALLSGRLAVGAGAVAGDRPGRPGRAGIVDRPGFLLR